MTLSIRDSDRSAPRVAVCVITYKRPKMLRKLLSSFASLQTGGAEVTVVVVDNDDSGSARAICKSLSDEEDLSIRYHVEPRRGIPFARNAAVQHASSSDFIAFIDDDERPAADWLAELLRAQSEYDADVVAGPVLAEFETAPPQWVISGRFFDRERMPTGTRLTRAYTGNVLVSSRVFSEIKPHFDEALALTGGEDALFFRRVHLARYSIIWCDEAVVYERVPSTRATAMWLIRRACRIGVAAGWMEFKTRSKPHAAARVLAEAGLRLARGILGLIPSLFLGRAAVVGAVREICRAWGLGLSLFGRQFREYQTTHGN
jgi:succinoglycan biosynthesis protein ExoM